MSNTKVKESKESEPLAIHISSPINKIRVEKATLRFEDKIRYINETDFRRYFPLGNKINEGVYGEVYLSRKSLAVKKFKADPELTELIVELNIYASNIHPCIMKPIRWTVIGNEGYLIMNRGKDIYKKYREGKITLEKILFDSMSAIEYLNSRGIAHGDIKRGNMVYYKGKCMLIDMGFAMKADLNVDNEYYIRGIAYTPYARDPEYYHKQYNNIKSEIFALAVTMISIEFNNYPDFMALYDYKENEIPEKIKWFILEARKLINADIPSDRRPSITELLNRADEEYKLETYIGTIPDIKIEKTTDPKIAVLMEWLVGVGYAKKLKVETVFRILHLVHRTYLEVMQPYLDPDTILQLYGSAVAFLAITVDRDEYFLNISYWKNVSMSNSDTSYETKFEEMRLKVLQACGGIISTLTYWDYAQSKEDLLPLLSDLVNFNYNPDLIREVVVGGNKCIRMNDLMTNFDYGIFVTENGLQKGYNRELNLIRKAEVKTCKLDISEDKKFIEEEWENPVWNVGYPDLIAVIMHNRHTLRDVELNMAAKIFRILYFKRSREGMSFVLDTICSFNWRNEGGKYATDSRLHPFGGISVPVVNT